MVAGISDIPLHTYWQHHGFGKPGLYLTGKYVDSNNETIVIGHITWHDKIYDLMNPEDTGWFGPALIQITENFLKKRYDLITYDRQNS